MDNWDLLTDSLKEFHITLTNEQFHQFQNYYELMIEWNSFMNLTAITEMDEVIMKHFVDSVSLIQAVPDLAKKGYSLIDIGTGAGFPGIPLKIVFPDLKITLLDSLNKRIKFLNQVILDLSLNNISALHGRAEDLAQQKEYREHYDFCVSRAVANLATLSEYCLPFVKIGGRFVSYKSGECDEEVQDAKSSVFLLGGKVKDVTKFELGDAKRSFIAIEKVAGTSKKYPRKAGVPSKTPLK